MNMIDFKNKVAEKVIGKGFDWSWTCTVRKAVEEVLMEAGIIKGDENYICGEQPRRGSRQSMYIKYMGKDYSDRTTLFYIEVKKKRGQRKSNWGFHYYDWEISDVVIWDSTHATIEDAWEDMLKSRSDRLDGEAQKRERAIQAAMLLQENFGCESLYDLKSLIDYMKSEWYGYDDELKARIAVKAGAPA